MREPHQISKNMFLGSAFSFPFELSKGVFSNKATSNIKSRIIVLVFLCVSLVSRGNTNYSANVSGNSVSVPTIKKAAEIDHSSVPLMAPSGITLYTYQSGAWDNIDVWTTDPGGTTLVGSKIPGNGDAIVILPSRKLTLRHGNVTSSELDITIREGGILDDSIYVFTQPLTSLSGQGTLKLKTTNFPVATINTLVINGGGTVEYYNTANFTMPASQTTYNNLTINCAGYTSTQLSNITLNGNLKVQSGTYQINDGTATRRTLVIYGDVVVNTGASMTVGAGRTNPGITDPTTVGTGGTAPFLDYYVNYAHRVEVYGNFINNGTVKFTNQPYPVFNAFPVNGFASVFFRGASDNTLTCNGTTDFYNLIVDKGTDQTYVLTVNSAGYDKFRIFGANDASEFSSGDASNPNIRKALWVRTGTIKLNGYVFIPSLVEGAASNSGDYYIPANGSMVLDGPDVVVMGTIDSYQAVNLAYGVSGGSGTANGVTTVPSIVPSGFSIYGRLQVNNGKLYVGEIGRIINFGTSTAELVINGGTIDTKQFQAASGSKAAYWQTGGNLILRGRFQRTLDYTNLTTMIASIGDVTDLNTARATYGGGNPLGTDPNVGTLNIDQDANIFHMEGGTIKIYDVTGSTSPSRAIEINSDPANIDVTGGNIELYLTTGSGLADADYGIASKAPLYNLSITRNSGTQSAVLISIPAKTGVTAVASPPLVVSNNLTLTEPVANASEVLNSSGFDVKIGGNFNIQTNAEYTPGTNHTILNGTGSQTFTNSGVITSGLYRFFLDKTAGTATLGSNIAVRDSLAIFSGTLNDGGYTLTVAGNIYNAGTHTGNGKIQLNGAGTGYQTLTASVSGTPVLGNLEINSTTSNAIAAQLGSDFSITGLTMTSGKNLNIGSYCLTVGSGGITAGSFSTARMIRTAGLSSDGGLRMSIDASALTPGNTILFPIGVSGKYTPATINGNTAPGSGSGYVTFIPVNIQHPAANNGGQHLQFYWKSKTSGMPTGTNVYYSFADNSAGDWSGGINLVYVLISGGTTWQSGGTIGYPNLNVNGITNSNGYIAADITGGNNGAFNNIKAYYTTGSGAWNTNIWSTTDHTTATNCGTCRPGSASDIIYIGGVAGRNDSITLPAGTYSVASITIEGSFTNDERRPVLNLQSNGGSLTADIITGAGKLASSGSTLYAGTCDLSGLLNNENALVQFYGAAFNLPAAVRSYPSLLITGGNTKTLPAANVVVRKDLKILDNINTGNILSLNSTSGDLTVYGNIEFQNGSKLFIPVSGTARDINIYGTVNFRYGNTNNTNAIEAASGNGTVHTLNFYGDSIISGASNLIFNPAGNNKIDLYFKNPGRAVVTYGSGTFSLNRLFVQKDVLTDTVYFKNNFVLNETRNNTATKSLSLSTGTLILSDPGNASGSTINLNLSSGGTNHFSLPSMSALILRNGTRVNITGNSSGSGIHLDGILKAEGSSIINLADGTTTNTGYIEYSGSGNSVIDLSGSSILFANQIRRSVSLTTGILIYTQAGSSTATIYGQTGAEVTRAKFEITGTGSVFNMSGTSSLSIINDGGTTFGDLFLRPGSSTVTGGDIIFGTNISGQSFKMDANVPLNNLIINTSGIANTLQLMVNPLVLNGNLILNNTNSILTTNNLNVTIKGNFTNNGIYNAGSNTTIFSGSTQSLSGANVPTFWNLSVSPSVKLSLGLNVIVNSDLDITNGTLEAATYDVTVRGNVINNGIYTNGDFPSTSRLYLNGTSVQHIAGTGSFGRIEIENGKGARLDNNITLSQDLSLTSGIFDINQYLLTLGPNSEIRGSGFGVTKMITSDGVLSNIGIRKEFSGSYTGIFVYPLGTSGKYAPAFLTVNATGAGYLRINAINDRHPATLSPYNVLKYFWEGESSISGFNGNLRFEYSPVDVVGTESLYVAARLIIPPGTGWSKAATGPTTDNVDENTHTISFDFPAGTNNLGGQYTAGYESDLPTTIPIYTSNVVSGNWDAPGSWSPAAPAGGPNGFAVVIRSGNTIYTNGNKRFAYKTTINGNLDIGTTYGHNLGTVDGTGKLSLQQANLPAGKFSAFLGCSGGTLEYGGTSNYTIVADRIDTVKNLLFTGSGTRTLPDKDLVICSLLQINGPTLDNSVYNRKLTIGGSFDLTAGTFLSGSGSGATVSFKGTSAQSITGFNNASPLNNLEINNSAGLTLNSTVEMNGNLMLTNGVITTSAANKLKLINQSGATTVTPVGGSTLSYINGPMSVYQFGGNDFVFPVGKATRYGKLKLLQVQTGTWEAEYFNSPYTDLSVTGLSQVSNTEYWRITSPANGKTAGVQLRWDSQSDINPLTTTGGISDIRVAEYNGTDWIEKASSSPVGNNTDGTVQTSANIAINNTGNPQFYTIGSTSTVKPTIYLGTNPVICSGTASALLTYSTTTGYPNQYTIDFDGAANTAGFIDISAWTSLPSSPISITVPSGAAAGTYYASIYVRASGTPSNVSIAYHFNIVISTPPSPTFIAMPTPVCSGSTGNIYSTQAGQSNYLWTVTGGVITAGGTALDNTVTVTWGSAGTGIVTINYSNASGCAAASATSSNITITALPSATISYSGLPWCSNAGDQSVTLAGTPGGTYSAPAGLTINPSTGTITPSTSSDGIYTVSYTIAASGGCGQIMATTTVSISVNMTWTGAVSTDWNNPGNWSCGSVPYPASSVQIPNVANKPVLSSGSAGSVNNLTIDAGSSLTITGNSIQIAGTITNNGVFDATDGTLVVNGSASQSIGTGIFSSKTIKNLTISNPSGVTLLDTLKVSGIVLISDGNLASNGYLVLLSSASGTALIDGSGTGNVTGNVTMQRYLPSGYGYKYFSSPFQAANVGQFGDDINLLLSSTLFYRYDENRISSGWVNYKVTTNVLNPFAGYAVNFGSSAAAKTADITGIVNNGSISATLYNHNYTYTKGFSLMGNPYPSPIDWNAPSGWTKSNIDNAIYFFKASTTDQYGGTYISYVNGVSTGGTSLNIIPSMQGFFVHVSNGSYPVTGTLAMNNNVRVTDLTHPFASKRALSATVSIPLIRLNVRYSDDAASTDPMVIYFDEKGTPDYDSQIDALKLLNTDLNMPNLSTVCSDGTLLSINALAPITGDFYTIPLGLKLNRTGTHTVNLKISDIDESLKGYNIFITDVTGGTQQDLLPDNVFSVTLAKGEYNSRFFLNFSNLTTLVPKTEVKNDIFSIYSYQGKIRATIVNLQGKSGILSVYNFSGKELFKAIIYNTGYREYDPGLMDGIYFVTYTSGSFRSTKKLFIKNP